MHTLVGNSLFTSLRLRPLYGNDFESLSRLYAPILGYRALGLYLTLYGFSMSHESIRATEFFKRYELTKGEFIGNISFLEALALIRTYQNGDRYTFLLHSPSTPRDFFKNVLLRGTLENKLGKEEVEKIRLSFIPPSKPEGEDISAGFSSVYGGDYSRSSFCENGEEIQSDRAHIRLGIDEGKLLEECAKAFPNISNVRTLFSEQELRDVGRFMMLYGIDEISMVSILKDAYSFDAPKGKRLDFRYLGDKCLEMKSFQRSAAKRKRRIAIPGESTLSSELRLMERSNPVDYLSHLQGGGTPSEADVHLVQRLALEMGLEAPVINALLYYLTTTKDGKISKNLAEKIAASLLRAHVETSLDAYDYLLTPATNKREDREEKEERESEKSTQKADENDDSYEYSEEELKKIMGVKS